MRSRSFMRWLTLAASCLALLGPAAYALEAPRPARPVAAFVAGARTREEARPAPVFVAPPVTSEPRELVAAAPRPVERPTPRLYVLHRALLR